MRAGAEARVLQDLDTRYAKRQVWPHGDLRQASELEASWTNVRGLSARIALFGDNASATLLDWLGLAFPNNSVRHISESYIADVSPRDSSYNVVVVAGREARRIRQIVKLYRPALNSIPKIAMLNAAMPRERAGLLNAGFDDVFELRMTVPEAQARTLALANRYALSANLQPSLAAMPQLALYRKVEPRMTVRERSVCEALFRRYPHPVSVIVLCSALPGKAPLSVASLRVLVSEIRHKLPSNIRINHQSPSSYSLEIV